MKIEYKLQNDVLRNQRMNYVRFEDYIMLTDGHMGCYFTEKEIKVDLSKIEEIPATTAKILDPKKLMETYQEAEKTRYAIITPTSKLLVRISNKENTIKVYIPANQLKMFYGYTSLMVSDNDRSPVLVLKYGIPYGIILPVRIFDDED